MGMNKGSVSSSFGLLATSLHGSSKQIQHTGCLHSGLRYVVCPSELAVDPHPMISKSVNPLQWCTVEALGVVDLFPLIHYPHNLALRLIEGKLP